MSASDYIDYDEDGNKIVRTVDGANRKALNDFAVYLITWGEEHLAPPLTPPQTEEHRLERGIEMSGLIEDSVEVMA
jgi:hypothetical protein